MLWTNFKRISAALVVSFPVAFFGAAGAKADLITEWDYQIDSAFTAFSPAGVTGLNPNPNLGNNPTTLQWGTGGNGPSSLVVDSTVASPPTVTTGGGPVAGASITHNNNPIGGQTLTFETGPEGFWTDLETGSTWTFDGTAVDGPLAGERLLTRADAYTLFWFAWTHFQPNGDVFTAP